MQTIHNMKKILDLSADMVNKTCYELFKNTPIKYFAYYKFYDSGTLGSFVSNPTLTVDLFHDDALANHGDLAALQKYGIRSIFLSHILPPLQGVADFDFEKFQKIISHAADHGSYNALVISDRFHDYYRCCIFAVNISHESVFNFYINSFNQLSKFINYFEENCREAISEDLDSRIILPNSKPSIALDFDTTQSFLKENCFDFLQGNFQSISDKSTLMTHRERECLTLIAQGYTMKTAAKKLDISHRTVEQHLRNIKDKLGLQTKSQLVEIWHKNKLREGGIS